MKIKNIIFCISTFLLLGCSQNFKNNKDIISYDKINFKNQFYTGDYIISNKLFIETIDKNCFYSEPYVKQSQKWKTNCPISKIIDNYYKKIKNVENINGKFGGFNLDIKKFEQKEKYFDDFTNSNSEINTLKLYLYTFKNNKKVDSINIYMHKNSIWGDTDNIYYFNKDNIFILELDTDVETGISVSNLNIFSINKNTGNFKLKESFTF